MDEVIDVGFYLVNRLEMWLFQEALHRRKQRRKGEVELEENSSEMNVDVSLRPQNRKCRKPAI